MKAEQFIKDYTNHCSNEYIIMTDKEKAKAYDEALERARKLYEQGTITESLGYVFPELKESEDEKVRKELIDYHRSMAAQADDYVHEAWIAWLERQDEYTNFCNKIQVGDKVTRNRDGVLVNLSQLKRVAKPSEKQGKQKASYTTIVETGNGGINALVTRELPTNDYEQKTAEKIEPFDKYEGLTDFERTLADICIGWIGEEFGWKQYIKDNADVLLKIAVEKFNSVQDVPFEQNPATSYCQEHCKGYQETGKCFADGDCKDKREAEQKSTWSEDDECKMNMCITAVEACYYKWDSMVVWLKSLKQRIGG